MYGIYWHIPDGMLYFEAIKETLLAETKGHLERCAADNGLVDEWHPRPCGIVTPIRLAVLFHGGELLFAEAFSPRAFNNQGCDYENQNTGNRFGVVNLRDGA